MLMAIDIGNTNIVIGLFDQDQLIQTFRLNTLISKTSDEYGASFLEIMRSKEIHKNQIDGIIISSVVPNLNGTIKEVMLKYFEQEPMFVEPGIKTGMMIKIDNPKQLGADLIVAGVAAFEMYGGPCIIIDMGTATTFSYLNAKKEFLGVVIVPGVKTSLEALTKNAANLSSINLDAPKHVVGKDSVKSIQSGIIFGTVELIDGMVRRIKEEQGEDSVVIITGGLAPVINQYTKTEMIYDENLVLEGLHIIYKKNQ